MTKVYAYLLAITLTFLLACPPSANAQRLVAGGQTNVALDFDTLGSAAGLTLSSTSSDVISPGAIANSVAFGINSRGAASLPTTFSYDATIFPAAGSFAGTIEHTGSVFFNNDMVEVGDFTIGFDAIRVGTLNGAASGFFVASTSGIAATLFDLEVTGADAQPNSLTVDANVLVSPEFGAFLVDQSLASTNLAGAAVGVARVDATAVPEPASFVLLVLGAMGLVLARKR